MIHRRLFALGVVLLVAVIGAACSGGGNGDGQATQVASASEAESKGPRPGKVLDLAFDDGSGLVSARIVVEPSPDLPESEAEVGGVFVRREDNSIDVGTGSIELMLDVEVVDGVTTPHVALSHNGPVIEVVVTRDTVVYEDVTDMPSPSKGLKSGENVVTQVIKPVDSLDKVRENTEIQVWGSKRGDRVIADILVYREVGSDLL